MKHQARNSKYETLQEFGDKESRRFSDLEFRFLNLFRPPSARLARSAKRAEPRRGRGIPPALGSPRSLGEAGRAEATRPRPSLDEVGRPGSRDEVGRPGNLGFRISEHGFTPLEISNRTQSKEDTRRKSAAPYHLADKKVTAGSLTGFIPLQNYQSFFTQQPVLFARKSKSSLKGSANFVTGFTLVETIVALALIVGALAGPFTLATRGIFSARSAKNKLVALNLAQEGIEIIRQMRDTNVINGENWRGIDAGGNPDCSSVVCTNLDDGIYNVDVTNDIPGAVLSNAIAPLRLDNQGLYNRNSGNETLFTRTVFICPGGACPDGQMRVVSEVTWPETGVSRKVQLEETLYRWQ